MSDAPRGTASLARFVATCACFAVLAGCGFGRTPLPPSSDTVSLPARLPGDDMPELAAEGRSVRMPILMYHHVTEPRATTTPGQRRYIVRPEAFRAQLRWLKAEGYESVTMEMFSRALHGEDVRIPDKPIMLTFDDGFSDAAMVAAPILKEEGFHAVFFIVVSSVQERSEPAPDRGHVSWEQLKGLVADGFEIEAHSMRHSNLTKIPHDEMVREIEDSRRILFERLGVRSRAFCYPYGAVNDDVRRAVREAGFELGVTIKAGVLHSVGSGFMDIERIEMQEEMERFKRYVEYKMTPPAASFTPQTQTESVE